MYIDETGIAADLIERHVCATKGTIRKMLIHGKSSKRQNIIAAVMTFEG